MTKDVLAQEVIHALAEAVQRGGRSLSAVPGLLRRLIDEGLWQERNVNGETVNFNKSEFRAFVEADYPVGLSTTLDTLEALCSHEPKVLDYIAQARIGKAGRPIGSTNEASKKVDAQGNVTDKTAYNISSKSPKTRSGQGTSSSEAFNRLRTEAYDIDRSTGEITGIKNEQVRKLYEDVLEKRKTPNAAAVEAGFRPPKIAVRLDNMHSAARTLAGQLTTEQLKELIEELQRHIQ